MGMDELLDQYKEKGRQDRDTQKGSGNPFKKTDEQDFIDLLRRIPGKVSDLQSEIDDHDRIKKGRG